MNLPQRSQRKRTDFGFWFLDFGFDPSIVLRVLSVVCGFVFLDVSQVGAAPQEVVPVNGATFRGELLSIDASGRATFRVSEGKEKEVGVRALPLNELVRCGNPAALRQQTIVVLADGGQIVTAADWAGDATVSLVRGDLVIISDVWGEVRLARGLVSGIVFAQQRHMDEREKLVGKVREKSAQREVVDAVTLTNGDRLMGKLTELDHGTLAIETRSGLAKAPLSRVEAISIGGQSVNMIDEASANAVPVEVRKFAIGFRDGSVVHANAIRADEKTTDIELTKDIKLKGPGADDVVAIQSLNGPVVYLSDLDEADYKNVPYLSVKWPFKRDQNVLGEPIVVRGKRYLKGIGMHTAARLTYRFDSEYRKFDSAIAVDDSAKRRGSVTFGVYVLREGKWGEAFKSRIVRGVEEPQAVSIDLKSAKGLTLTVDFADRGDELDHAMWLDARLVR